MGLSYATSTSTTAFPFLLIMDFAWDIVHWGTMLYTCSSWKSSCKFFFPRSLVGGCYNSSSMFFCSSTSCGCYSTISWVIILGLFQITMTYIGVEVVIIHWKNCKSTSSFLSNFLLISCCSKVLCSFSIGFCEANVNCSCESNLFCSLFFYLLSPCTFTFPLNLKNIWPFLFSLSESFSFMGLNSKIKQKHIDTKRCDDYLYNFYC